MLPYILTAITGMVCGIVLMRLFQTRSAPVAGPQQDQVPSDTAKSPDTPATSPRSARFILIAAALIAVIAIGVAIFRKDAPTTAPAMLNGPASAPQGTGAPALADVDTMIAQLESRLKNAPNDGEGYRMLGWSYSSTGKPAKAVPAYERALALLPGRADVHAGYGEALVGVAKGSVTPQAKQAFDKAISLDPKEPRARFFLSLYKAQNGQEKTALEEWIALANGGPANAPWQGDVRSRIQLLALKLGVNVADRLAPAASTDTPMAASAPTIAPTTMESAAALPADQQRSMIDGMVEGLAAKLKSNPRNAEGWARLLRSRMVLGQQGQASRDLVSARKALAGDTAGLALVNAAARENGVPGN